jgi:hypothetical protein
MSKQITDAKFSREFALAGNATLTLVSVKTGTRLTFRVRASNCPIPQGEAAKPPWFVGVLSGRDNESDYTFLGTIFVDGTYRHGRKSKITPDAPSAKGFAWVWSFLSRGELPPGCEVWHQGKCGRCGRKLSVPESIERGLGPECADGGF